MPSPGLYANICYIYDISSYSICCECMAERYIPQYILRKVRSSLSRLLTNYAIVLKYFYLSSSDNTNSIAQVDQIFTFPEGSVNIGQDNVITIVQVGFVHFFCYKNN